MALENEIRVTKRDIAKLAESNALGVKILLIILKRNLLKTKQGKFL